MAVVTRMPLSVSRARRFRECRLSFKLIYLDQVLTMPQGPLDFGRLLHRAIERLIGFLIKTRKEQATVAEVTAVWHEVLREMEAGDSALLAPAWDLFERFASRFRLDLEKVWKAEAKLAINWEGEPVEWDAPDAWLRGILDLVSLEGGAFSSVTDWKSAWAPLSTSAFSADLQPRTYAMLLHAVNPMLRFNKVKFHFIRWGITREATYSESDFTATLAEWRAISDAVEAALASTDPNAWRPTPGPQCSTCVSPDTPVLLDDYSWIPAGKIQPGERVIGVDEFPPRERLSRRMRIGEVTRVMSRRGSALRVITNRGAVVCSPDHLWLARTNAHYGAHWRQAESLRPGHHITWLVSPPATDPEDELYMGGYIRGLIDGDGAVQERRLETPTVRVAMADVEALERLTWYLQYFGLISHIEPFAAVGRAHIGPGGRLVRQTKPMWQVRFGGKHHDRAGIVTALLQWPLNVPTAAAGYLGGMFDAEGSLNQTYENGSGNLRISQVVGTPVHDRIGQAAEVAGLRLRREFFASSRGVGSYRLYGDSLVASYARFFTLTRPAIPRKRSLDGKPMWGSWARIEEILPAGENVELVDLTVSGPQTFIAAGFVSHNCPVIGYCPLATALKPVAIADSDSARRAAEFVIAHRALDQQLMRQLAAWVKAHGPLDVNGFRFDHWRSEALDYPVHQLLRIAQNYDLDAAELLNVNRRKLKRMPTGFLEELTQFATDPQRTKFSYRKPGDEEDDDTT